MEGFKNHITELTGIIYWDAKFDVDDKFIFGYFTPREFKEIVGKLDRNCIKFETYTENKIVIRVKDIIPHIRNNKINQILNEN